MITIHFNDTTLDVQESDDSYRYRSLMGDHNLTLKFSLPEYVEIPVGAWCEYMAIRYTLAAPANIKKNGTRDIEYTLIMESAQYQLNRYKLRNTVDKRLKFSMCATPKEYIQVIVDNLNQRDSGWAVGDCIVSTEKTIAFDHSFVSDALQSVADTFNSEWEIVGKTIHLKKVEYFKDDPLPLSYGKGNGFVPGVGRTTETGSRPVEILFVQGGSQNIDRSKYGSAELLLPKSQTLEYEGRTYISDADGYSIRRQDKAVLYNNEDSLDCSEIYPSRVGKVTKVEVIDEANNFYDIIDNTIPENLNYNDYLIEGENMTIIFQSGMLAGDDKAFELKYNHAERRFEIVPQEIDGLTMPGGVYIPHEGDTYAIFGCMLPDAYICDNATKTGASWDMFREAARYLYENEDTKFTFSGELQGMWAKRNWLKVGGKLVVGGYVLFTDNQFAPDGVKIRITGIKDYLTSPYAPTVELSNSVSGKSLNSTLNELENGNVIVDENQKKIIQFTKRRFRDSLETIDMLEQALLENFTNSINPIAVQTMAMLVGDESLQFRFVDSSLNPIQYHITYNQETKQLIAPATVLQHMTLGIDTITSSRDKNTYKHWTMSGYTSPVLDQISQKYYFYAKVPTGTGTGEFVLSPTAIGMNDVSGYYHLLVGVLNSEYDGERSFATLYGFTEVLPGRITTDKIVSADGKTYFDLANSIIGGNIKFRSTNGTDKNVSDLEDELNERIDTQAQEFVEAVGDLQSQIDGDFKQLKQDAVMKETIIEGGYLKNSLIDTENLLVENIYSKNGNFQTTEDGTVKGRNAVFEGGTFTDVLLQGSLRNPFVQETDSIMVGGNQSTHDNVATISVGGGWITNGNLEWDVKQSGRRMCITNYRWGSQYSQGTIEYTAPTGKYFYENGISKNYLRLSRECVELIGYGTSTQFYGWIVLNRINLMTESRYGRKLNALAMGIVTGSSSETSISYKTFDGTTMSVSRTGEGQYSVNFSSTWFNSANDCIAIVTGLGYSQGSSEAPIKATVIGRYSSYITVNTSDDASRNDGSFMFIILNINDWLGITN